MSNKTANLAPVSMSQLEILKVLKRNVNGLSVDDLKKKVGYGVAVDSGTLGPVFDEVVENYPDSLRGRKMVKAERYETGPALFFINAAGERALEKYSTRRLVTDKTKVPPAVIDRAVKKVRDKRTYGIERYTDEDLKEVRGLLPEEFWDVPLDSIRAQMENRRKQGAYARDFMDDFPEWYKEYRAGEHFATVTQTMLTGGECAINPAHKTHDADGNPLLVVLHRRLDTLGKEVPKDVIVVCPDCAKRIRAGLPKIPKEAA